MTATDDEASKKIKDAISLLKAAAPALCGQRHRFLIKDILYMATQLAHASYSGDEEVKQLVTLIKAKETVPDITRELEYTASSL